MENWQEKFRKLTSHSQFIDYSLIEKFIEEVLTERDQEFNERVRKIVQKQEYWIKKHEKLSIVFESFTRDISELVKKRGK